MNFWLAAIIILASVAAMTGLLLLVRRFAPHGSYFHSHDRAAGVFGVLATAFSVLLAFVIFLAFTSYDGAEQGAESEAVAVAQQFETAAFLPGRPATKLQGQLVCYGRAVVSDEWPLLDERGRSPVVDGWSLTLFQTFKGVTPTKATEQSAYDKWLDQTSEREEGRRARLHNADSVLPAPLWFILIVSAVIVIGYMVFFADPAERHGIQALLIGTVTVIVVTSLLVVDFFDHPYRDRPGGLRPDAMETTLSTLDGIIPSVSPGLVIPCDEGGNPI